MIRYTALILIVIFLASAAAAQTPPPPPPMIVEDKEILRIESRLVVVPVSVLNANGEPIFGLSLSDFQIREEQRIQEIVEVSDAEKVPLEIAVLFDVSGSTDPMFKFEQETAAKFLSQVMRPIDRATIFTIGESPNLVQNRNVAFESIETIRALQPRKEHTAFFDTVTAASRYLLENSPPKSRKVIITISDGEDNTSEGTRRGNTRIFAELEKQKNSLTLERLREIRTEGRNRIRLSEQAKTLKMLQDADTVFYSINPAGSSYRLNKISVAGQDNMERFASETGGTAFLPKFLPIDLKNEYESASNLRKNTNTLEEIFRQLANELQAQYLVQYYSDGEYSKNDYVNLNVTLKRRDAMTIRARRGYFVKQ